MGEQKAIRRCPFPDCDWKDEYDPDDYADTLASEEQAERHYEDEHAGKVELQVTLTTEMLYGHTDPNDLRAQTLEEWENRDNYGWKAAHVRSEVIREADDHTVIDTEET